MARDQFKLAAGTLAEELPVRFVLAMNILVKGKYAMNQLISGKCEASSLLTTVLTP